MQTAETMAKDLVFKMRIDESDRERLEALAKHYSAPAATVLRILVKERFDDLHPSTTAGVFEARQEHDAVLDALRRIGPAEPEAILEELHAGVAGYANWTGLPKALNELRRAGLVAKRGGKYARTAKALPKA